MRKLTGALRHLATGIYAVTRFAPGSYGTETEDGRYRRGTAHTFRVRASVQPLSGGELLRLPEGERTRERIVVFTARRLKTASQQGESSADQIEYQRNRFEVELVESWNERFGYYRCVAAKIEE